VGTPSSGVSESQLDNAEKRLGMSLPTELRLLYRLHNGQNWSCLTPGSVSFTPPSHSLLSLSVFRSIGLFGGYCLYHHRVSSVMSSLNGGVKGALVAQMSKGIPGERQKIGASASCSPPPLRCDLSQGVAARRGREGLCKRAAKTIPPSLPSFIWVDENGNVKISGTPRMSGGLTFDGAPLSSGSEAKTNRQGDGSRSGSGGNLLAWLEEYRRRVEGGWYHTQKLRFSSDPRPVRPIGVRDRKMGLTLQPSCGNGGCVSEVTMGVEVQVSPVFVAELCTM
ncbi:unnamed protein product, partial [Discosporangium mesarthrocarpum]